MERKTITLISSIEDNQRWIITLYINRMGRIYNGECITFHAINKPKKAAYDVVYHKTNKDKIAAQKVIYHKTNKDKIAASKIIYYQVNKDRIAVVVGIYRNANRDKICKRKSIYNKANKSKVTVYRKTEKGKITIKRRKYKRKRGLGFIPLNLSFTGSHGHHITKNIAIFIPSFLHGAYRHNIWTGKNMKEINEVTMNWLLGGWHDAFC